MNSAGMSFAHGERCDGTEIQYELLVAVSSELRDGPKE